MAGGKRDEYDPDQIEVLPGLEAVRRRPGMYVGEIESGIGLHSIVFAVVERAVDEALNGECRNIAITLHADGSVTVADDGCGIPPEPDRNGRPLLELMLTTLFGGGVYHGQPRFSQLLSLAPVNALCEWLRYENRHDGQLYTQEHRRGMAVAPMTSSPSQRPSGLTFRFLPDAALFPTIALSFVRLAARMHDYAHMAPGVTLTLSDERDGEPRRVQARSDRMARVMALATGARPLHREPIVLDGREPFVSRYGHEGALVVAATLLFTDGAGEDVRAFVSGVATPEGGTHVSGLRRAIQRALSLPERGDLPIDGLVALLIVWHPIPRFDNWARQRLTSADAEELVARVVEEGLRRWLADHSDEAQAIIARQPLAGTDPTRHEAEARLIAAPDDVAATLVHADRLLADGDPRGELIALEHRLHDERDPVTRAALDARAATLLDHARDAVWARPGGFPFRARWRGRSFMRFEGSVAQLGRDGTIAAYARVRRFLEELTDCLAPRAIDTPVDTRLPLDGYTRLPSWRRETARWLGDGAPARSRHQELAALVATPLALHYRFRFVAPGTRVLLPYQGPGWYAHGLPLDSSLSLDCAHGSLALFLQLPCDNNDELRRLYDAIIARLGPCFSFNGFAQQTPAPHGDGMLVERRD
jgi:uncharacterized protein (TIGR02996 family)